MKNRKRLMIPCPNCSAGKSKFYKYEVCTYCRNNKEVDILFHFKTLDIRDSRIDNVRSFLDDPRFFEYLELKF